MQKSDINKRNLDAANINLMSKYKTLKARYYDKLIRNSSGNAKEFFAIMRNKRKPKQRLPVKMNYLGHGYYGEERFSNLNECLSSCFAQSLIDFDKKYDEFDIQLSDIRGQAEK